MSITHSRLLDSMSATRALQRRARRLNGAAQILRVFGVVPDCRIFKLAIDFGQALMLLIVVKDTPEWFRNARTGP